MSKLFDADDTAASAAGAKTDDKAAQTDVSAFKPQYSEQQPMQAGDAENTAKDGGDEAGIC